MDTHGFAAAETEGDGRAGDARSSSRREAVARYRDRKAKAGLHRLPDTFVPAADYERMRRFAERNGLPMKDAALRLITMGLKMDQMGFRMEESGTD
jgi:hypothetical protein